MCRLVHVCSDCRYVVFFFKQKTAYEMRISDWSSDVRSSDLIVPGGTRLSGRSAPSVAQRLFATPALLTSLPRLSAGSALAASWIISPEESRNAPATPKARRGGRIRCARRMSDQASIARSEEHTSELQSLMRISYAVFCLKKKKT